MRHPCRRCDGTGVTDEGKVRCWNCHGNGLDPAEYFAWSQAKEAEKAPEKTVWEKSIIDLLHEKMVQHEERVRLRKEEEAKQ
jgi:hypothetical protein